MRKSEHGSNVVRMGRRTRPAYNTLLVMKVTELVLNEAAQRLGKRYAEDKLLVIDSELLAA